MTVMIGGSVDIHTMLRLGSSAQTNTSRERDPVGSLLHVSLIMPSSVAMSSAGVVIQAPTGEEGGEGEGEGEGGGEGEGKGVAGGAGDGDAFGTPGCKQAQSTGKV